MPKVHPIQNSFSTGEISPLAYGRSDIGLYRNGLLRMRNMIPDSRGPARRRPGARFINTYDGNDGRCFSFQTSDGGLYILTFLNQICRIDTLAGALPQQNFVQNPRFASGGTNWTTDIVGNGSVVFNIRDCRLTVSGPTNASTSIAQQITVTTGTAQHNILINSYGTNTYRLRIGTAINDGSILDVQTGDIQFSATFVPNATTFFITITAEKPPLPDDAVVRIAYVAVTDQAAETSFVTPYLEADLKELQGIQAPQANALYLVHPKYPVYKMTYDESTDTFSFTIVTFTAPPSVWAGQNWPGAGTFFQGRLWLGGTPNQPETFWGSKSGTPEDFTTGSTDDAGLEFTLAKFGRIQWMQATKNLLIGTDFNEFILTSQTGVITPSDVQAEQQSAYGSNFVQAVQIGDEVFYVSSDGLKLRAVQYEWSADNWLSRDITFPSEHITESGIRDFAWAQNPDNLLWCVLNNGTVVSLVYERSNNIFGWALHSTNGRVLDITAGILNGTSFAVSLVQRVAGKVNLEVSIPQRFLDSWVLRTNQPASTTVTGLDHLEGFTVQVITDGAVHPDRVVSGGQITLQWTATEIYVGLQFISEMETLPIDTAGDVESTRSYIKHWNKVYIEILDSIKPLVNGVRAPERTPSTPMNIAEPSRTEVVATLTLGRTLRGSINIKQDLPDSLDVLAIYGELAQESIE